MIRLVPHILKRQVDAFQMQSTLSFQDYSRLAVLVRDLRSPKEALLPCKTCNIQEDWIRKCTAALSIRNRFGHLLIKIAQLGK